MVLGPWCEVTTEELNVQGGDGDPNPIEWRGCPSLTGPWLRTGNILGVPRF